MGPRPASGTLTEALASHGYADEIAAQIEAVGLELRVLQEQHGVEFAAMLDADTGASLAPYVRGTATSVVTEPHLRAMVPGQAYVQIHSHPSAATFSIDDVAVLFDHPSVRTTAVVAAAGWWYVMSVEAGADPYPVTKIYRAYDRAWRRLEPAFLREVEGGRMSVQEAGLGLHRAIWRTIAASLNFLYHEVTSEVPG